MDDQAQAPRTLHELGRQLRIEADLAQAVCIAAQAARQHLAALIHSWDDLTDAERLESLEEAHAGLQVRT